MTEHDYSRSAPDWEGFGRDAMEAWPLGGIDGFELQDLAEKHGLIARVPGGYDPERDSDCEGDFEKGDEIFDLAYSKERREAPGRAGFRPTLADGTPDVRSAVRVTYTNWRGETANRVISPVKIWFGATEFHPSEAWLLHCYDHGKADWRDYELAACDFRTSAAPASQPNTP